ncbi:Long-chain-fatty-acid--CoA ligase [Falsiruegeria litorea R37]|uniref:Long-chain-fatty-acid--CoA ligase n=1 Tax=Falsiruegeria litorea R37 TaxID=1200284 RepID=A0A1Y5SI90_9RHOB|nr:class I adenylate-forming enzyme family protein [Falsiruegeria litorea]SLN40264.1 Long-chain-fatty-acid--CoA ligase [Falsiruegeria litorea R37]
MTGLSYGDAVAEVLKSEPMFETTTVEVDGVSFLAFKNIPQDLRALLQTSRAAQENGQAEYLVFEGQRLSYDAFCNDINKMAHVLQSRFEVLPRTRVAVAMSNRPEMLILMMAISSIGATCVFLNAWWTTEELRYALQDTDSKLIFTDTQRLERLKPLQEQLGLTLIGVDETQTDPSYVSLMRSETRSAWPTVDIDPDSDFAIMYSSGTTSDPKGVALTHRGAVNAVFTWLVQATIAPLINPPDDPNAEKPRPVTLITTPLFHVTATHPGFLLSLPAGAKVVLMYKWDAQTAVDLIETEGVTRFVGVPTQSADIQIAAKNSGKPLETLTQVVAGGAKRPPAQVSELAQAFPQAEIATGWGMTETNAIGIGLSGEDYVARPGAAGRLFPPLQEMMFLDEDGSPVALGSVGEMTVKSVCNMRTYLNKPIETSTAMQDGWFKTGDLGFIDDDGIITIVDRKKNIIIRGGENIACLDVEDALHQHPAILEACAFAIPHARLGEVVGAAVQTRPGMTLNHAELSNFLRDRIARFKTPEHLWVQTTPLPRGATDKIDRRALRKTCMANLSKKT